MYRIAAFLTHLLISMTIVGILLAIIFFVWYPQPYFSYEGAYEPLTILVMVDVVLGPLLTLIIFKPGKKGLKMDLTLIAIVQITALLYGSWTIWSYRPMFVAYSADRFFIVGAGDIDMSSASDAIRDKMPIVGPQLVYAEKITDGDHTIDVLLGGAKDIHQLPEQYRSLSQHLDDVKDKAISLTDVLAASTIAEEFFKEYRQDHPEINLENYYILPIHGRLKSGAVLIDPNSGELVAHLDLDIDTLLSSAKKRAKATAKP